MAFMIKEPIDLKGILILMLLTVTSRATNLDCNSKAFHCVNSTHFMICVDLGTGTSTTIDDVIIPCPSPTVCRRTNRYECEFPLPSIPSSTVANTVSTESEVTTLASLPITSIPYEEYFDTVRTTSLSQTELHLSPADALLSVKPITEGLDTFKLSSTEKVITEKSVSSYGNQSPGTVVDGNHRSVLKPSDNNANNVENAVTLKFNVIPNDAISENSIQGTTQTLVTETSQLNTEYISYGSSSSNNTITESEQKTNGEHVITTNLGPTLENSKETVYVSSITEIPVNVPSTDVSVTIQQATTEQDFGIRLQDVTNASALDTFLTLHDTTILLDPTVSTNQNVKETNESRSVGDTLKDSANNFNVANKVSQTENVSSRDNTSDMLDHTVNTERGYTDSFQEVTVNETIMANFSTLPDTTTFTEENTPGSETIPKSKVVSGATRNTESALLKYFNKTSVNTEALINTTSIDITNTITEPTVISEQSPTNILEKPFNATVTDDFSIVPITLKPVEQPRTSKINASINNTTDDGSVGFFETNVSKDTTTNIVLTKLENLAIELPGGNNLENETPASLITTKATVTATDNTSHQKFYQTTTTPAHAINSSLITELVLQTEPANEGQLISDVSISDNEKILDFTGTTDAAVTMKNATSSLNRTKYQYHFKIKTSIDQDKKIDGNKYFSLIHSTAPGLVTEAQFIIGNNFVNHPITVDTGTTITITEGPLKTEVLKHSENSITSTTEPNHATETVNSVLIDNLEIHINPSTMTSLLDTNTENLVDDPQNDAESINNKSISYDINIKMGNITDGLTQNEKVLSVIDAEKFAATVAYKSDSSSRIETTTLDGLFSKSLNSNPELLLNEDKTVVRNTVDANKLLEPPTESITLSLLLPKIALNESKVSTNYINQTNDEMSAVAHGSSSVTFTDGNAETVTDRSSTPIHNVTTTYWEHKTKGVSSDSEYKAYVTVSEITTLPPPINQNMEIYPELINTLQQNDTIPMDTTTSYHKTTMAITETAFVPLQLNYSFVEKTKKISEDTSSILTSDLIQTNMDQNTTTNSIKTSGLRIVPIKDSQNFSTNVQSATELPRRKRIDSPVLSKNDVNDTTIQVSVTKSYLVQAKNTLENSTPVLLGLDDKNKTPSISPTNTQTSLNAHFFASVNFVAPVSADNSIGLTTDSIPVIENTVNPILREKGVYDRPKSKSNITEKVSVKNNSSNSASISQTTIISNTQMNLKKLSSRLANVRDTASEAPTKTPVIVNIFNHQNLTTKEDSMNKKSTAVNVAATNSEQKTITIENVTASLVASNLEPLTFTGNITSNSKFSLLTSNLDEGHNPKVLITTFKPSSLVIPVIPVMQTTNLPTNDLNARDNLLVETSSKPISATLSFVPHIVTKSMENEVSGMVGAAQILTNNNHDINVMSFGYNKISSDVQLDTVNLESIGIKPILNRVTLPIDLVDQSDSTIAGVNTDVLNAATTEPINAEDPSNVAELPVGEIGSPEHSNNGEHVAQIPSILIVESVTSDTYSTVGTNSQEPLTKMGFVDHITNTEPMTGPFRRDLTTTKDSQVFLENFTKKMDDKVLTTAKISSEALLPAETSRRGANISWETGLEAMADFTTQSIVSGVQSIRGPKDNDKSLSSSDFSFPTKVIRTSDVLVDNIESEKTHSGILTLVTPSPKPDKSIEKEEKTDNKETEAEEQHENPLNIEIVSLQDKVSFTPSMDIISTILKENNNIVQRDIVTGKELLVKTKNNGFKTTNETKTELHFTAQNNTGKNIHNSTNAAVSGYKKETPKHELFNNSTPSTNNSHTSNNKLQDQNMGIPEAHNESVISNDQRSTSRYMPPTKSTAAQTTVLPALESTTHKTELNTFSCKQKKRGRYADELDCRKFYICPGNKSSHMIEGTCPVNTVFSEINKQCTKNLSHCIRNNQFRCVTEGRFSDFLNYNIYYICVKNNLRHFIRFKLQCQNGYHLNKTSVRCDLNIESTSTSESKSVSEQSSSLNKQDIMEQSENKFKCKKQGVFPDPLNCKKYFECTKDGPSYRQKKKKCDSDEIFHKDKKKCVDADSYEC